MEKMNVIHDAVIKSKVAVRYYKRKTGIVLNNETARSRFDKDNHIDPALLMSVAHEVWTEWRDMILKLNSNLKIQ